MVSSDHSLAENHVDVMMAPTETLTVTPIYRVG